MIARPRVLPLLLPGALLVASACVPVEPVLVRTVDEVRRAGPLELREHELRARREGDTLLLFVPPAAPPGMPTTLEVAIRDLDDGLVEGTAARVQATRAMDLAVDWPAGMENLPVQSGLVLHVRVTTGDWTVAGRRSMQDVLRAPGMDVSIPADAPAGQDVPVLVGVPEGAQSPELVGAPGVITDLVSQVAAGAAATARFSGPGIQRVTVSTSREGVPRSVTHAVAVRPTEQATMILSRTSAAPGEFVDVLAWRTVDDGERLAVVVVDARAAERLRVSTSEIAPRLEHARVYLPPDLPGEHAVLLLSHSAGTLGSRRVGLGAPTGARLVASLEVVEERGQVAASLVAWDPAGRPLQGRGTLEAWNGTTRVASADSVLLGGRMTVLVRASSLVGAGRGEGSITWTGRVRTVEGDGHAVVRWVPVGGDALQVVVPDVVCAHGQECAVDVFVVNGDGMPAASSGAVSVAGRSVALNAPEGVARVSVPAPGDGAFEILVEACGTGGCGHASAVLRVRDGVPGGWAVPSNTRVGETLVILPPSGAQGSAAFIMAEPGNVHPTFRDGRARTAGGPLPVEVRLPGLHDVMLAALDDRGSIHPEDRILLVEPRAGVAPTISTDGRLSAPGTTSALGLVTCGLSELGSPWARGRTGAAGATLLPGGDAVRVGRLQPDTLAGLLRTRRPAAPDIQGDELLARERLAERVRADLRRITLQAQLLAAEGTLVPSALATWVERRRSTYVDLFGRRYELVTDAGRLVLTSAGIDETPGTGDDVEAAVPIEALLAPREPLPEQSTGTALRWPGEGPATWASPLVTNGGLLDLEPPCGTDARLVTSSFATGAVGSREVPLSDLRPRALWLGGPHLMVVGDKAWVGIGARSQGGATIRASIVAHGAVGLPTEHVELASVSPRPAGELLPVHALRPGMGRVVATAAATPAREHAIAVLPSPGARAEVSARACGASCEVDLAVGETLLAWTSTVAACRYAVDQLAPLLPAEAAGMASLGFVAGEGDLAQVAVVRAVQEAGVHADQVLPLVEVLRAQGTDPSVARAALESHQRAVVDALRSGHPLPTLRHPSLFRAWAAASVGTLETELAGAVAREELSSALFSGEPERAALAFEALAYAGQPAQEDALLTLLGGTPSALSRSAAVLGLVRAGRPAALSRGVLLDGPMLGDAETMLQDRVRLGVAWCAYAHSVPADGATVTVTDLADGTSSSFSTPARAFTGPARLRVQGAPLVGVLRFLPPADSARITTRYNTSDAVVTSSVVARAVDIPAGRGVMAVAAGPGFVVDRDSLPANAWRGPDGRWWWEPVTPDVSWVLRADTPAHARARATEWWAAHVATAPRVDAPPVLRVSP